MIGALKSFLKNLYHGPRRKHVALRWTLVGLDVLLVSFFVFTTFLPHDPQPQWVIIADYAIGAFLSLDWLARMWVAKDKIGYVTTPLVLVDLLVILSLFAPALTESFVFLRVLRTLRLLRSYHLLRQLSAEWKFFKQREEIMLSALNLLVFIFVVSALVYALQVRTNEQITNYVDALYFTITTLTTTGFGDITLSGTTGRLLAVFVMIVGVSLFLRLVQSIFRPRKVSYECPDCGLSRHDHDAVHCKHCGRVLHIENMGD
ncbi:MAG: potassium channel family protein [Gammaproteobacteria bacterium]|nr:potassium channel family protein [Gammaproteobacteria bacterium]